MSYAPRPFAIDLERRVGRPTRLLAIVMGLSLVDGIFPALVLAGALDTTAGVVETGLLVFGGSATFAVLVSERESDPRAQARRVIVVGALLTVLAVTEAALAPTIASVLDLAIFRRFAGLVLIIVAVRVASARVGERLPHPGLVVLLGAVASFDPAGGRLVLELDPALAARAAAAVLVGVAFALLVVGLRSSLDAVFDVDRFRFGSAVALGVLGVSALGLLPEDGPLPLAVLGLAALLSLDPSTDEGGDPEASALDAELARDAGRTGDASGDDEAFTPCR